MPKVRFEPSGVTVECDDGETVFAVARRNSVPIETTCGGKAFCGLCRVKVLEGEEHLSAYNAVEERYLGNVYYLTKTRLACQTQVHGDAVVQPLPRGPRRTKGW